MGFGTTFLDREMGNPSFGLIGFSSPRAHAMRFIMWTMKNAFLTHGWKSHVFIPASQVILDIFNQHCPSHNGNQQAVVNYNHENSLANYKLQNPLSSDKQSLQQFYEAIDAVKPNMVAFMFTKNPSDSVLQEMKFLHSKRSMTILAAVDTDLNARDKKIALPSEIDFAAQLSDANGGGRLAAFKSSTGSTLPIEEFEKDPKSGLFISAKPSAAQLTIAEVDAQLYDLRAFDAQQSNPDKVKDLLKRRQELTGTNKRPSFMS